MVPVILGLAFRQIFPQLVTSITKPLKYASTVLLGIIFTIKIFAGEDQGGSGISWNEMFIIFPIILFIHLTTMFFSYLFSKSIKIEQFRALTISIEVGLQNTTLALLITSVYLSNNEMSKPAVVYAMFSFFSTILFGYILKQRIIKN